MHQHYITLSFTITLLLANFRQKRYLFFLSKLSRYAGDNKVSQNITCLLTYLKKFYYYPFTIASEFFSQLLIVEKVPYHFFLLSNTCSLIPQRRLVQYG